MKWKQLRVWLLAFVLISTGLCNGASSTESTMLDLSPFFWERFITPDRTNTELISVTGRQTFDGLPFQVDGRACLFGRGLARQHGKTAADYPDIIGVKVGRSFDELHLLHATQWTDREQEVVAKVRFNYVDGTQRELPIAYGVHVRDWQCMQSEEREIYTDPNSKVIWRGPGVARFKSTTRMSKTTLSNPSPDKVVSTIDFISTGKVASYDVAAATVSIHDPNRPVTPPVPIDRPELLFDAVLTVRVVDMANQPIEGALVSPSICVGGSPSATLTTPLYTGRDGTGPMKYPKADCAWLYFVAQKEGWTRVKEDPWVKLQTNNPAAGEILVIIRMTRDSSTIATANTQRDGNAKNSNNSSVKSGSLQSTNLAKTSDSSNSLAAQDSNPHPLIVIRFPVGSKVRVEASDTVTFEKSEEVTSFESLPTSPYAFTCGYDCSPRPRRFYRAVWVQQ